MKNMGRESFRRGFVAGFSSPYQLVYGPRPRLVHPRRDFVSMSWAKVGTAIREALDSERDSFGKTSKPPSRTGR
jgi:hypothetical protein